MAHRLIAPSRSQKCRRSLSFIKPQLTRLQRRPSNEQSGLHLIHTLGISRTFLEALIAAVPYKIHTVLTDNGIQFTFPPRYAGGPTARYVTDMFDMHCHENGIEHRLTKINHPCTNGPGRAHEPHDQGSDRPTLPLRST